jgi:large subunit ribosomal protein L4
MPVVDVYNLEKKKVGTLDLSDDIFDVEVREHLFHEMVRAQLGARRSGTATVKERNAIIGSTAKVWKQKGTGRARQGSKKGPHWVGGGVAHGPSHRSFAKKVNKKTRKAALRAACSRRQQEGKLVVLDGFDLEAPKTKQVCSVLDTFGMSKALIVDLDNANLAKSARNLPSSMFLPVAGVNVYDVLRHDVLVLTKNAAEALQERLA